MQNQKSKNGSPTSLLIFIIVISLVLPTFGFAQEQFGVAAPQTVGEAKELGMTILSRLPEAVKNVWQKEALPIWKKMWEWVWPFLEPWRQKLLDFLGKEIEKMRPAIEEEIKEEIKKATPNLVSRATDFISDVKDKIIKPIPLGESEHVTAPIPPRNDFHVTPYDVSVLVISYFPIKNGRLDPAITGMDSTLSDIRSKTKNLVYGVADLFTESSIYHGYKNSSAEPSLVFKIFEEKEFLEPLPHGLEVPWQVGKGIYRPDYYKILSDLNICNYIDNKGLKFVWLMGYHYGSIEPVESNMSMGRVSKAFWNYGTYGDVSNSEQTNDLPLCNKTYILQNLNFGRDIGMEAYGHHLEAVFRWIDNDLFWNKFVGPSGDQPGNRRCGWMHYPPNGAANYDFSNERKVESDCEDWKPDGSGEKKIVDCHTWYKEIVGSDKCGEGDTEGYAFQKWWAQNIPGANNTLAYNGKIMRNWWEFIGDFDAALAKGKTFFEK